MIISFSTSIRFGKHVYVDFFSLFLERNDYILLDLHSLAQLRVEKRTIASQLNYNLHYITYYSSFFTIQKILVCPLNYHLICFGPSNNYSQGPPVH
jgi:hypothetical protein